MGCTSGKQQSNKRMASFIGNIPSIIPDETSSDQISELIKSIQQIVLKLENYYSRIMNENEKIPKQFALLQPIEFVRKLEDATYMTQEKVQEIEHKFSALFNQLSKIIVKAQNLLFDYKTSQSVSKERRDILLTFIILYENTCQQFFAQQKQKLEQKLTASLQQSCLNTRLSGSRADTACYSKKNSSELIYSCVINNKADFVEEDQTSIYGKTSSRC